MPRSILKAGAVAGSAAIVAVLSAAPATSAGATRLEQAPVLGTGRATALEGRYIVVLQPRTTPSQSRDVRGLAARAGGRVTHQYGAALDGFAARLPERAVQALRSNPHVSYLEADQAVTLSATQSPATWGLDRVDQRTLPLSNGYTYATTGSGVTAYIVDTGILAGHTEFGSRVASGYTAVNDGRGTRDCNGHGTHVAGTVGGTTYGVAKQVTLRPVRVLDCAGSGSNSGVIAGVDWVTSHHTSGPAVANMSLGGGASAALDTAVNNSINDGVTYAVAAGNDSGADACTYSPARVPGALTVGSTTKTDTRSGFSNVGSCLDLFAPGSSITSAWHTSTTATSTISGTSMATPHAAGVAAQFLQSNPTATPATVRAAIVDGATRDVVVDAGAGSPNRLLYSPLGTPPPPPPPSSNLLGNPGFESGATVWSASAGVIDNASTMPAHAGAWKAWLNGYGVSHTDSVSQTVTIPAATRATLTFWLRVDTAETTTSTVYDRLRVQVVSGGTTTTLTSYSNLNATGSYQQRQLDVSAYAGRTVTLRFVGTEDSTAQTSFVVDDTSLTTG